MFERTRQWIEIRLGLNDLIESHLKVYNVPKETGFMGTLGLVALIAIIVQSLTGVFLLMYYIPHPDHAFSSIRTIMNEVPYGWLFRSMHVVGSNLIIAVLFIHLLVTFYKESYKIPREMTWISGGLVYCFIFLFCISGYLLSWNQLSYWSTTILTTIPSFLPFIGESIGGLIRGGDYVTGTTLSRFFAFHVAFLPFIVLLFIGAHIFMIRRVGFASDPRRPSLVAASEQDKFEKELNPDGKPFYSHYLLIGFYMTMIYFAVLFFIMTFFPAMFESDLSLVKADPLMTPDVRPPWYFLFPYQVIRSVPNKFIGIGLQLIFLGVFILWPFIDTVEERNISRRPLLRVMAILLVILWLTLTIMGGY
ncbi:MAG: cytochrome bc complex cytochrome b subunit [Thermodesulfovibrionales bacterium]